MRSYSILYFMRAAVDVCFICVYIYYWYTRRHRASRTTVQLKVAQKIDVTLSAHIRLRI